MLKNILLVLITFFGFLISLLIARFTREELNLGKKYFVWFKRIVLVLISALLFYFSKSLIFFAIGLLIGIFIKKTYLHLGLGLMSSFYASKELLVSSLIFIFGFPYGALIFKKKISKEVLKNLILFLLPFILVLVYPRTSLMSLAAGALIWSLK